jgi:hypothetical protein
MKNQENLRGSCTFAKDWFESNFSIKTELQREGTVNHLYHAKKTAITFFYE